MCFKCRGWRGGGAPNDKSRTVVIYGLKIKCDSGGGGLGLISSNPTPPKKFVSGESWWDKSPTEWKRPVQSGNILWSSFMIQEAKIREKEEELKLKPMINSF